MEKIKIKELSTLQYFKPRLELAPVVGGQRLDERLLLLVGDLGSLGGGGGGGETAALGAAAEGLAGVDPRGGVHAVRVLAEGQLLVLVNQGLRGWVYLTYTKENREFDAWNYKREGRWAEDLQRASCWSLSMRACFIRKRKNGS
jgi:hypothetical protein